MNEKYGLSQFCILVFWKIENLENYFKINFDQAMSA